MVCKKCGVTDPPRGFYGKYDKTCRACRDRRRAEQKYHLSSAEFDAFEDRLTGHCRICDRTSETALHIDHDHATGKVRGLLCRHCNLMLGHARDDIRVLARAIDYLQDT